MRIGFIGLGNMGGPMALNLIKAGHTLIVHDVRRAGGDRAPREGREVGRQPEGRRARGRADPHVAARPEGGRGGGDRPRRDHLRRESRHHLRGPLDRLAHRDAPAPRHVQGQGHPPPRRAGVGRRVGRRARHAPGDGGRRGADLQRGEGRAPGRRRQGRLHGADRLGHHRQARAQHDQHHDAPARGRGLHARREGGRQAGGAARGHPRRLVRAGAAALADDPHRRLQGRVRHRALRPEARPEGRGARHRAGPRVRRADADGRRSASRS